MPRSAPLAALLALAAALPARAGEAEVAALKAQVVQRYAANVRELYGECEVRAATLAQAIDRLVAAPGDETLAAARQAWCEARRVYGLTEVFRFYDGPIDNAHDGVESFLNAWPVDESYIDAVIDAPDAGIVNDVTHFPTLGPTVLMLANEQGGETNISVGWHAIEFLLWGQDLDENGPGARSWRDYLPAAGHNAVRRGEYLVATVALLRQHLAQVRASWEPGADNYRRMFEAKPDDALRRMLEGAVVLSGFELSGERMAVAYETRDQEQEHSCFSDTTLDDLVADQLGIVAVLHGGPEGSAGPGLLDLVRATQPALADPLQRAADATTAALRAIPPPFDRAIRAADDSPGRKALLAAMTALEHEAELLASVGLGWGYHVPLRPGG